MKKKHTPKPLRIPITQGLVDQMGQTMHFALLGMQHGDNSVTNWKSVARTLLTISVASDYNPLVTHKDKVSVDNCIITLRVIADRELETGSWRAHRAELGQLAEGILAAERMLPKLDYRLMSQAYRDIEGALEHL